MTISAALLAGGESRRMGRDKATIVFRERPLWQHQLETLRLVGPKQIFVSARIDPVWRPPDVEFVSDEKPSRGPLSGIAALLSRITTDHILVLAIDVPFVTVDYLKKLHGQIDTGRGVVPMIGTRAEPLVAIYPREAAADFQNALDHGELALQRSVRKLIESGRLRRAPVGADEISLFRNFNEPQDVERD